MGSAMVASQKPHVFLSYVREDAERVERLAADLKARGSSADATSAFPEFR